MDRLLTTLKGVGPAAAQKLEHLGLVTVQDALFHLPSRYQDRSTLWPLAKCQHGQEQRVAGEIVDHRLQLGRRRSLLITIDDGSGRATLRFFYFANAMREKLKIGAFVDCFGDIRQGPSGIELVHPQWNIISRLPETVSIEALTPIYPATEGVSQKLLLKCVTEALESLEQSPPKDYLSTQNILAGLPSLDAALHLLHRPPLGTDLEALKNAQHPAVQRLAIEELCGQKLALWWAKAARKKASSPKLSSSKALRGKLLKALGFELTGAQQRVLAELDQDLEQNHPMTRLIQGDVGSGKTAVAAAIACNAIEAGWQVAIMAPTEILAEQHFRTFEAWFSNLGIKCAWIAGKLTPAQRRQPLADIADGSAQLVIGTHALFQESVRFEKLGLVIIDEQHRFGVEQRRALIEKNNHLKLEAHQLAMTATPIPRTLAMTAYADIDVSVIDELPPGRTPVKTVAMSNSRREEIIQRMDAAMDQGRQVYWVCTLIDESEQVQAESATAIWEQLCLALPNHRIGLIHGRMKSSEKDLIMQRFKSAEFNALVATTVIEVGVDVPNASLMIIDNAERLGLSQLHQLRGRVGRGTVASSCVLLYQPPLGNTSRQRLDALRQSNDGFWIAERDLELRGPGEILGVKQTGIAQLKVAQVVRDRHLLPTVDQLATQIWCEDRIAVEALIRRWVGIKPLGLSKV